MTADRSSTPRGTPSGADDATLDAVSDELEDDEFEDELEAEDARRGQWPLGTILAFAIGLWAGRWFEVLPSGLESLVGYLMVFVTAVSAAGLYRRWVRRQFAQARARRAARQPEAR